jgi:hypothetical protein
VTLQELILKLVDIRDSGGMIPWEGRNWKVEADDGCVVRDVYGVSAEPGVVTIDVG